MWVAHSARIEARRPRRWSESARVIGEISGLANGCFPVSSDTSTEVEPAQNLIAATAVNRIPKAEALSPLHVVHINSTFHGGGVTEILTR